MTETYLKWTSRIAICVLAALVVGGAMTGIAFIPSTTGRHNTVWPLPRGWAFHHVMAKVEMTLVWGVVGLAILCGTVALLSMLFKPLLRYAGWMK